MRIIRVKFFKYILCLSIVFIAGCAPKNTHVTSAKHSQVKITKKVEYTDNTDKKVNNILKSVKDSSVGVYYESLEKHAKPAGVHENMVFYAASVAKLPVVAFVQNQINHNKLSLDTNLPYQASANQVPSAMVSGGTGVLQFKNHQAEYTISDLLKWTVRNSDNQASNQLLAQVCYKNPKEFKQFIYQTYGSKDYTKYLSAKQAGQLIKTIYHQSGPANIDLKHTDWQKSKIGKLPVDVEHKIGINDAYNQDAAIVLGKHPFVLTVMTKGWSDQKISDLAKRIYNVMS